MFADYLAMVGDTQDHTLATGLTSGNYPYIAVASISIPDTFYWAKVLSLKLGTVFVGVQYSNDGALLIANNDYMNNYLVIFNA